MQTDPNLPARSLLDRPQRLGFLPTMWFWNDGARQRELLPIALPVVVAVALLTEHLAARFPALSAPLTAIALLHPFLLMGLVERHIRKQLRERPAAERLAAAMARPPRAPLGPIVPMTVGGAAAVLLAAATLGALGALGVLALVVALAGVVQRRRRRPRPLHADAGDARSCLPP